MNKFITSLEQEFKQNANPHIAFEQKRYMKNKFEFLGIQTPVRKKIQKPFLVKKYLPKRENAFEIIKILWQKHEREYQYFAMDLLEKYNEQYDPKDIDFLEFLIINKSWWDTVDKISQKFFGIYFNIYPEQIKNKVNQYINSGNIWLQRTAILFQLKYKEKTDIVLLDYIINKLNNTNDFFINKAIGWILREYGKTNPDWVIDFVNRTKLSNLSKREALKIINN